MKNQITRRSTKAKFFVAILSIFVLCNHIAYVLFTHQYPQWDEHNYLLLAVKFLDILLNPGFDMYSRMLHVTGYLQPMYSGAIAFFLLIFGTGFTYKLALLLNGLFFVGSVIGTYKLARDVFDETIGIMAAVVFACLGNALFYLHFTYTETALTFWVVWSLVWLHRSEGFYRRRAVILAAFFFVAATMTRWIAPVFLAGSVLAVLAVWIKNIIRNPRRRRMTVINMILFVCISVGVPLILYFLPNQKEFFSYVVRNQQEGSRWVAQYRFAEMADTFSTRSAMYYFNILSQNTVYIFLMFLAGFFVCLRFFKKTAAVVLSFLIPYAFLTFIAVWKEDRFLVPLYPAFSIIVASGCYAIRGKIGRVIMITFLIFISLLSYLGAQWAVGPMGARGLTDIVLPSYIHHPRRIYLTPLVWPPTKEYVNAHLLFKLIGPNNPPSRVLQLFVYEPWDNAVYSTLTYEKRNAFVLTKIDSTKENTPDSYSGWDYLLVKNRILDSFRLIGVINVPIDQSTVYVYKIRK
jgi:4-amino-4-deoxy-L-arabinose transferase-like glycosyltransferase